jgi:DNA-binding transcriptional regulator YiaG
MGNHPNRSKRNPGPGANPKPADIVRARGELTQREAAELIYASEGAWQNWEQGQRPMHPAFFELFLLKAGQSELGVVRPGTYTPPARYDAKR